MCTWLHCVFTAPPAHRTRRACRPWRESCGCTPAAEPVVCRCSEPLTMTRRWWSRMVANSVHRLELRSLDFVSWVETGVCACACVCVCVMLLLCFVCVCVCGGGLCVCLCCVWGCGGVLCVCMFCVCAFMCVCVAHMCMHGRGYMCWSVGRRGYMSAYVCMNIDVSCIWLPHTCFRIQDLGWGRTWDHSGWQDSQ